MVDGFHQAFSMASGRLDVDRRRGGCAVARGALLLKELPLKTTSGVQDAEAHLNRIAAEAVEA